MDAAIAQRLVALNKEFYQRHAASFSATRSRLQPGVLRVLAGLPALARVLDLGCGNGGVAAHLATAGHQGGYLGLDFSLELLAEAGKRVHGFIAAGYPAAFVQADLSAPGWAAGLSDKFDAIFAFAVLHHIPSRELRLGFLRQARGLLAAGGQFVHSNWQFMRSPRLAGRVQPWALAGLDEAGVDPGDYLLDWRSGGNGLRYAHQFSEEELAELAEAAGFRVQDSFLSDGAGGNLALYQHWE